MNFITIPSAIEAESMHFIRSQLQHKWPEESLPVVERLIHTSGDPTLENVIAIHPLVLQAGKEALKKGALVITDVEMVRAGVSKANLKRLGGNVECFLNDPRVPEKSKEWGLTRTMTAFRLNAERLNGAIIAIGNAPTALIEVLNLCEDRAICPALIIGMPVGFVGAKESKELLWKKQDIPSITIHGTRGGSPLAAATVNALIYSLIKREG